jgi:hypothetical protein
VKRARRVPATGVLSAVCLTCGRLTDLDAHRYCWPVLPGGRRCVVPAGYRCDGCGLAPCDTDRPEPLPRGVVEAEAGAS